MTDDDNDAGRDEALLAAAKALGLTKLLEVDRNAFESAFLAAEGFRNRRGGVASIFDEPAHVYAPTATEAE